MTPAASASEQYPGARDRAHKRRSFDVARRHRGRTILGSDVVLLSILDGQIELYIQIYYVYFSVLFWQNRAKRLESPEKLTSPWIRRSLAGDKWVFNSSSQNGLIKDSRRAVVRESQIPGHDACLRAPMGLPSSLTHVDRQSVKSATSTSTLSLLAKSPVRGFFRNDGW